MKQKISKQNKEKQKNRNQGFTLIELLVVILIIGILAAIALPQYKLAVEKARIAQVLAATKSITQAQEIFYMINSSYTSNMKYLDIDINIPKGWSIHFYNSSVYHKVEFHNNALNNRVQIISYYKNCGTECLYPGRIYCVASKDDEFANKLCAKSARVKGFSNKDGVRWLF